MAPLWRRRSRSRTVGSSPCRPAAREKRRKVRQRRHWTARYLPRLNPNFPAYFRLANRVQLSRNQPDLSHCAKGKGPIRITVSVRASRETATPPIPKTFHQADGTATLQQNSTENCRRQSDANRVSPICAQSKAPGAAPSSLRSRAPPSRARRTWGPGIRGFRPHPRTSPT
jgi:hypothetical protein